MSTFSSNLADAKRNAEAMLRGLDESDLSQISIEKEDKIILTHPTGTDPNDKAPEELTLNLGHESRSKSPKRTSGSPPPGISSI